MSLTGTWKSRGYGWVLDLNPDGYSLFDIVPGQGVEFERGSPEEFDLGFQVLDEAESGVMRLRIRNDITAYTFDRINGVPDAMLRLEEPRRPDPLESFDFLCSVFQTDYAFFERKQIDWPALCADARARISAQITPKELLSVFADLILPLADNHVLVSDGHNTVISDKIAQIKSMIMDELGMKGSRIGDPQNVDIIGRFIQREFLGANGRQAGNGAVHWGMLDNGIAYLNVIRMFGVAETAAARAADDLPPRRPDHASFLGEDLAAIDSILDEVMADIAPARALVLDVRLNGGGFDILGMQIANRLADRRRLAFTKYARYGDCFTERQAFHIEPAGDAQFARPVYLLTSARTASAGDVFALCMRALPHVTIVGQPSTGILSDNLRKHLPNGWYTSISNEYYCAADGQLFEGPGVPVDVETPVFVPGDFRAGYHLAVDKAVALARSRYVRSSA